MQEEGYWFDTPEESKKSKKRSVSTSAVKAGKGKENNSSKKTLKRKRDNESGDDQSKKRQKKDSEKSVNSPKSKKDDGEKSLGKKKAAKTPSVVSDSNTSSTSNSSKASKKSTGNKENNNKSNKVGPEKKAKKDKNDKSKDVSEKKDIKKPHNSSATAEKKLPKKKEQLSSEIIKQNALASSSSTSLTDTTSSAVTSSTVQEIREFKHAYEDPNWLGNEDEAGSVASGVLEEDYCFECGKSTLDCLGDNSVILCDICDGEYHINCVGLDKPPRSTYVCLRCLEEEEQQKGLRFNVSETFRIPKRKIIDRHVVYSPSRPLEMAWEECTKKGVMTVSKVLSYEIMRYLTHGTIENTTTKGRVVDVWRGATVEIASRLHSTTCHNLVDREGRFDLKLPNFVVEYLKLNEVLEPILEKLRTIMGTPTPQIRTHNVVFVPVGSKAQQWHTDDELKPRKVPRYYTILIQLNSIDSHCGGTEIWSDKLDRGDLIRCRPGDALVFPGSLLHRGQANLGYTHRFFYYASFSCGADMNVGDK